MKAVLISIQPQWCHRIIDGEKTIEVRKTKPKLDTPFKVYIYCSAGSYDWRKDPWTTAYFPPSGECTNMSQMVIGEFVCDGVYKNNMSYDCEGSCVSVSELKEYANGKPLYGWHISELKIYDKPKKLGNFWKAGKCLYATESGCTYKYHCFRAGQIQRCGETLTRPPQSWCYVEELQE